MKENLPVPCVCILFFLLIFFLLLVLNHEKCSLPPNTDREHVCTIFVINLRIIFPFPPMQIHNLSGFGWLCTTKHIALVISETHSCSSFPSFYLVFGEERGTYIFILLRWCFTYNTFTHFKYLYRRRKIRHEYFRGFRGVCWYTISISRSRFSRKN